MGKQTSGGNFYTSNSLMLNSLRTGPELLMGKQELDFGICLE